MKPGVVPKVMCTQFDSLERAQEVESFCICKHVDQWSSGDLLHCLVRKKKKKKKLDPCPHYAYSFFSDICICVVALKTLYKLQNVKHYNMSEIYMGKSCIFLIESSYYPWVASYWLEEASTDII